MFESLGIGLVIQKVPLWMAQVPVPVPIQTAPTTPERAALVFSGPRFFVALIAGVLLAFALQFLLTNASVAFGLSFLGNFTGTDSDDRNRDRSRDTDPNRGSAPPRYRDPEVNVDEVRDRNASSDTIGGTINKIGTAVGLWTLITVTIALFIACFLAVKLSLLTVPLLGAITGLVIWAAYFSLLVWVSSTTVGSFIGSVVNTATAGFQAILGTAAAAIGAKAASNQVVATAEAAAGAIRRELTAGFDPEGLREQVEDYLESLRPPELDIKGIRQQFESILNDPQLKEVAATGGVTNIDRSQLLDLVSSRTDLSKRDVNRIVDQLEDAWEQVVGKVEQQQPDWLKDLISFLQSAEPERLRQELGSKLDQLISTVQSQASQASPGGGGLAALGLSALGLGALGGQGNQGEDKQGEDNKSEDDKSGGGQGSSLMQQALKFGFNQMTGGGIGSGLRNQAMMLGFNVLMSTVLGRTDLSELDVQQILNQLREAKDKLTQQAGELTAQVTGETPALPYSTVRADVENYLLNAYSWRMNRETIAREFRDVLYDPQADPGTVRQELEKLSQSDFEDLLRQRGVFTQAQIGEITEQLEGIRQEVIATAKIAEEQEKALDLRRRVEAYLLLTKKEDLNADAIASAFKEVLSDADTDVEVLRQRFAEFDRDTLIQLLSQREDFTEAEATELIAPLESARDAALLEAEDLATQAKAQAEALWLNLESYLRNTGKEELNPEGIKRDLQSLLDDPQSGLILVRARLSRFDRDTLVQLLSQRQDLTEEEVNDIINRVQDTWGNILQAPGAVADKAKEQYDNITTAISDYLRNTGVEQLNPEAIQRDLQLLLNNPSVGAARIRDRLATMDRNSLVQLLSQRQDMSEEQINQTIDQVQQTIDNVVRAPRRLAARTQAQVQDFQTTLQDYLRNTGKEELNPEAIKRDLQLLLHDPRVGMESLADRLAHLDRETLISLLSQRPDMSEAEAAEAVDRVLGVRDQFVEQIRSVQRRVQDVVDGVFERIRYSLNSLDRPELNYDGIKQDLRTLFDDPQAGFDALRDRLSHFNRDTLVAVLSSRDDISEADANRLVDQIERTRNTVLQRAERIQRSAQERVEAVKRQAQQQAEETRKAAASAAWWLFWTAVSSGGFSALAGALAVFWI